MEWTIYLDMDAFYVSCELRDRPELKGRPVIVGPDPTKGPSRGVVLSASYEARPFGVRSAQPVGLAHRLCPEAVWIDPDMEKYVRVSHEVRAAVAAVEANLAPLSIDEMAVRVDVPDAASAEERARALQRTIREQLGLPVSVGVATSQIVAKIATDLAKPGGVKVVPPDGVAEFLGPLSVRAIPGVGPKTGELLHRYGVETIADLRGTLPLGLRRELGDFGAWLRRLSRGIVLEDPRRDEAGPRSRSVDCTLEADSSDLGELEKILDGMVERLVPSLEEEHLAFQTVTVALRWADFEQTQRSRTLAASATSRAALQVPARRLLAEIVEREGRGARRPTRRLSLRVERLRPRHGSERPIESFGGAQGALK
ncbi:MAG: DNA polymerase IV [Thermoplasmata archaeon]|nr:DNA polymerase IV [Thermoplasmata archaeon]